MIDRKKVVDALRNCINKPKCQDCHWEECDKFHETIELPKGLVMDMYDLLKDPDFMWKDRIMRIIRKTLHETHSLDTNADKDFVCELLEDRIYHTAE